MLSTAIAYSIAFFSVDPRVVLVKGYMVESRFHNPICNSAVVFCGLHYVIELPSSPHDWYIMTLHTYIQSWKFAYLFSSSEEKIKFTCQKVRCVSSNNNREEQKKFHFRQQQHIGLLITLVEFQLRMNSFLSLYDVCYWSKIWKGSNQFQKRK